MNKIPKKYFFYVIFIMGDKDGKVHQYFEVF